MVDRLETPRRRMLGRSRSRRGGGLGRSLCALVVLCESWRSEKSEKRIFAVGRCGRGRIVFACGCGSVGADSGTGLGVFLLPRED